MIQSMTGFGRGEAANEKYKVIFMSLPFEIR